MSAVRLCREAIPHMQKGGWGRIIHRRRATRLDERHPLGATGAAGGAGRSRRVSRFRERPFHYRHGHSGGQRDGQGHLLENARSH